MKVEQRRRLFVEAIKFEKYGKCPKAPADDYVKLCDGDIDTLTEIREISGDVEVVVADMSKLEIRYCLNVCQKLGFKPEW
jgi:hypothetical protein